MCPFLPDLFLVWYLVNFYWIQLGIQYDLHHTSCTQNYSLKQKIKHKTGLWETRLLLWSARPALAYIAHECHGRVLVPQAANIHISIRLIFPPALMSSVLKVLFCFASHFIILVSSAASFVIPVKTKPLRGSRKIWISTVSPSISWEPHYKDQLSVFVASLNTCSYEIPYMISLLCASDQNL